MKKIAYVFVMFGLSTLPLTSGVDATEGEWTYKADANQGGSSSPAWCFEAGGSAIVVKQFGGADLTNVAGSLDAVEMTLTSGASGVYLIPRSTCTDADFDSYGLNSDAGKRLVNGCIDMVSSPNAIAESGAYDVGINTSFYSSVPVGPSTGLVRWSVSPSASDPNDLTGEWIVTAYITAAVDGACVPVPRPDNGSGEGGFRKVDRDYLMSRGAESLSDTL